MKLSTLSESTGKTHGMRFKMAPPANASSNANHSDAPGDAAAVAAPAAGVALIASTA